MGLVALTALTAVFGQLCLYHHAEGRSDERIVKPGASVFQGFKAYSAPVRGDPQLSLVSFFYALPRG